MTGNTQKKRGKQQPLRSGHRAELRDFITRELFSDGTKKMQRNTAVHRSYTVTCTSCKNIHSEFVKTSMRQRVCKMQPARKTQNHVLTTPQSIPPNPSLPNKPNRSLILSSDNTTEPKSQNSLCRFLMGPRAAQGRPRGSARTPARPARARDGLKFGHGLERNRKRRCVGPLGASGVSHPVRPPAFPMENTHHFVYKFLCPQNPSNLDTFRSHFRKCASVWSRPKTKSNT